MKTKFGWGCSVSRAQKPPSNHFRNIRPRESWTEVWISKIIPSLLSVLFYNNNNNSNNNNNNNNNDDDDDDDDDDNNRNLLLITKLTIKTYLQLIFAEEEKIFSQ